MNTLNEDEEDGEDEVRTIRHRFKVTILILKLITKTKKSSNNACYTLEYNECVT